MIPREVKAEEPLETTPAQCRGEICQGSEVVQRAAQVELLQGTTRYAESRWMNECQLVVTEIQEVQVDEGREAMGRHLCNPVKMTTIVIYTLTRYYFSHL